MKIINGFIKKQISNHYTVIDKNTKEEYLAQASGKLRHVRLDQDSSFNTPYGRRTKVEQKTTQVSPKVGDVVEVALIGGKAMIEKIKPRKNDLNRPDVANVDQVLLVFSAKKPEFSFNLLDKFLVILGEQNLKTVLLVSKIDLATIQELNDLKQKLNYYSQYLDLEIYYVNSKQKVGFDVLDNIFKDKITVLAGQTGVGKSTLLNALIPELEIKTQEISKALGRGKHTTRHSELYDFNDGYICDTPGFSKVEINLFEKEDLKLYYDDFLSIGKDCRFSSCNHVNEPGCAVKDAVSNGIIPEERYNNYLLFFNEILKKKDRF